MTTPSIPTNIDPALIIHPQGIYVDGSSNVFMMNITNSVIIKYILGLPVQLSLMAKEGQGFTWRGAYDATGTYNPYDVFRLDQSSYIYKGGGTIGYQYTNLSLQLSINPPGNSVGYYQDIIYNSSGITPPGLSGPSFFFTFNNSSTNSGGVYCVDKNLNFALITLYPPNVGSFQNLGFLALDTSGNIYFVCNQPVNAVYKVNIQTGQTIMIAWPNTGGFYNTAPLLNGPYFYPNGIAVDAAGYVYVSSNYNHVIAVFPPPSLNMAGYILTGSSGSGYIDGPVASAQFSSPHGLLLDGSGNLYVADTGNHKIRKINLISQQVTTITQTGYTSLPSPTNITYDTNGKIYVSSVYSNLGIKIISNGQVTSIPPGEQFTPAYGIVVALPDGSLCFYASNTSVLYNINYVNTNYELLCEKGANGAQGPQGPPGPISPITIVVANHLTSVQSFSPSDKGNTYIITSDSSAIHNITTGTLGPSDAGFYVYLRNGNPNSGYNIIIYHNGSSVNDSDDVSVLFAHNTTRNASNCILYWSGTDYTLY